MQIAPRWYVSGDHSLTRDRRACAQFGAGFSWAAATGQFLAGLAAMEVQPQAS